MVMVHKGNRWGDGSRRYRSGQNEYRDGPEFTLSLCLHTPSHLETLRPSPGKSPLRGVHRILEIVVMNVLDGISLLLAIGLFAYLLVALLLADKG